MWWIQPSSRICTLLWENKNLVNADTPVPGAAQGCFVWNVRCGREIQERREERSVTTKGKTESAELFPWAGEAGSGVGEPVFATHFLYQDFLRQ